jgi:hypothetical protein
MTKTKLPTDAKQAWLPPGPENFEIRLRPITPGLRDWRTQMSSEHLERFEAAAGELLTELGYVRGFPHPGPESLENASRVRESFANAFRI